MNRWGITPGKSLGLSTMGVNASRKEGERRPLRPLVAHFPKLLGQTGRPLHVHRADLPRDRNFERLLVLGDVDLVVAHAAGNEERVAGGEGADGAVLELDR